MVAPSAEEYSGAVYNRVLRLQITALWFSFVVFIGKTNSPTKQTRSVYPLSDVTCLVFTHPGKVFA